MPMNTDRYLRNKLAIFVFGILIQPAGPVSGQTGINGLEEWDEGTLNRAATAKETHYLNPEEKKVYLLTNLARANGKLFSESILKKYVEEKEIITSRYLRSLYTDLATVSRLPMLEPARDLFEIAKEHAIKSGHTGHVGHKGFNRRTKGLLGKYLAIGENCDYGNRNALDIVMSLLIDDGIPDMGHRNNMLNKEFNTMGIAIRPHKTYRYNCVMSFGKTH